MNTNERIARGLGWTSHEFLVVGETITGWTRPDGLGESVPDYEHSLDALLETLGVLRERGWSFQLDLKSTGNNLIHPYRNDELDYAFELDGRDLPGVLALAVADALEASK